MPREREPWQIWVFILWLCLSSALAFAVAWVAVAHAKRIVSLPGAVPLVLLLVMTSTVVGGLAAIAFKALGLTLGRGPDGKVVLAVKPLGFDQAVQTARIAAEKSGSATRGLKAIGQTVDGTWEITFYKPSHPRVLVRLEHGSNRLIDIRKME